MRPYAAGTSVASERSRAEIETLLGKHGATQRGIAVNDETGLAQVAFVIHGHKYRLDVPMPPGPDLSTAQGKPRGWYSWDEQRRQRWAFSEVEQSRRERWRAIVLLLKAKLELVQIGISSVEKEFLSDMVLANGETMHHAVAEALSRSLATGKAPVLALPEANK
jgi:hypothetical protein